MFVGFTHQTITTKRRIKSAKSVVLVQVGSWGRALANYAYQVFKINEDNVIELWKTAELYNVNQTPIVKQKT